MKKIARTVIPNTQQPNTQISIIRLAKAGIDLEYETCSLTATEFEAGPLAPRRTIL